MLNNIFFIINCFFVNNKIYINFKLKKYQNISSYDFTYIDMFNVESLKKILLFPNKDFNSFSELSHDYHSFDWLQLAKKLGGVNIVSDSKKIITNWNNRNYKINSFVWKKEIIAKRIINLIYHFDFFAGSLSKIDQQEFIMLIIKNYLILKLKVKFSSKKNIENIIIEKSILLFDLTFGKDNKNFYNKIKNNYKKNINIHSLHNSMNPVDQAIYIINLFEIKNILLFYKKNVPDEIEFQIIKLISTLKNFFHLDGTLALFNGSNNSYADNIKKLCNNFPDLKIDDLKNISEGIAIFNSKNIKIFFDVAKPNINLVNDGLHAGTLSIEMSCENEKIITNCGSLKKNTTDSSDYLRYSAAHSTIIIENTNISELGENKSYIRIPQNISFNSFSNNDSHVWEATHDGYRKKFRKIIKRKLTILESKFMIIGEDSIISLHSREKNILYNIRFHLSTNCNASLSNNKKSVLIKTKLNNSFIFKSSDKLSIEESIVVKNEKNIERTSQIVISGHTHYLKKNINWSLEKF